MLLAFGRLHQCQRLHVYIFGTSLYHLEQKVVFLLSARPPLVAAFVNRVKIDLFGVKPDDRKK